MGMKARLTLKAEHHRAKKFRQQYGDQLVYVRYRYDRERKKRFTTVEIIIEEADWEPRVATPSPDTIVKLQVSRQEYGVQNQLRCAGGRWNFQEKVWELPYGKVLELSMQDRIVDSER